MPPRKEARNRAPFILRTKVRWALLACLSIFTWVAFNFVTLSEYIEARNRRNHTRREVRSLEADYSRLVTQKQELETWGFAAEKALRERYKMVKPGENVLLLNDKPDE